MKLKAFPCFLFLLWISHHHAFSQHTSYYVVIGGFSIEANAQRLLDHANNLNFPALYAMNSDRNLYYVYVRMTQSKGDAYAILLRMQQEGFKDAWVFNGSLEGNILYADNENRMLATEEPMPEPATTSGELLSVTTPTIDDAVNEEPPESTEIPSDSPSVSVATTPSRPAGKPFIFKLTNEVTGAQVSGQVHLLESERANQYRGFNGNEKVYVVSPNNRDGKWHVVCHVIGFRPYKKSFAYSNPGQLAGAALEGDQEYIIPVTLSRVKKGDYIELDEVKFFENSNVLSPQAERELAELIVMMEENPDYRIKLHGHTNGDYLREIISRSDSQNFFALDPGNKRSQGSAKLLSALRAETLRDYLISKGIDGERITVKGEGGRLPAFDPKGTAAARNARVEVEITKH